MNNKNAPKDNPTVYTTEQGRICPVCQQPVAECKCKATPRMPRGDGVIRVSLQTKGRKGKKVTILSGFTLIGEELSNLATELKRKCGAGGSLEGDMLEIQGDMRQRVEQELIVRGFKVKRVGG